MVRTDFSKALLLVVAGSLGCAPAGASVGEPALQPLQGEVPSTFEPGCWLIDGKAVPEAPPWDAESIRRRGVEEAALRLRVVADEERSVDGKHIVARASPTTPGTYLLNEGTVGGGSVRAFVAQGVKMAEIHLAGSGVPTVGHYIGPVRRVDCAKLD